MAPRPAPPPWPLALLLLLLALPLPARAADDLEDLQARYHAVLRRRDETGYREQQEVLTRIADLATPQAERSLDRLLERYGEADPRRAALLLAARVRHGAPATLDQAIAWVEAWQRRHGDLVLLDLLPSIVAAAQVPETRRHLRTTALRPAPPPIKARLVQGLAAAADPEAVPELLLLLKTEQNLDVRAATILALGGLGEATAVGPLVVFLHDSDARIREVTARALGMLGQARALPALVRALRDESPRVVESAAGALGRIGLPEAIEPLIDRLALTHETDLRLADAIALALFDLTGKAYGPAPEVWREWWNVVKGRPWTKPEVDPAGHTVAGARYYGFPVRSSRLVFVLDVSRSMGWNERIDLAKEELIRVVESLSPTARFDLIAYSDVAHAWQGSIQEARPATVRKAVRWIQALDPVRGRRPYEANGTNTFDALARALADREADTICFLSDGYPSVGPETQPDRILAWVREQNRYRRVRIHVVALVRGDPPSQWAGQEDPGLAVAFMQRLAEENDGRFRIVR